MLGAKRASEQKALIEGARVHNQIWYEVSYL